MTPHETPDDVLNKIEPKLLVILDNLEFASEVCEYLSNAVTPIPLKVTICVAGRSANKTPLPLEIKGTNCSLVVTPLIYTACLDVRRVFDFIKIDIDKSTGKLSKTSKNQQPDDWYITHLGLREPLSDEIIQCSQETIMDTPFDCLKASRIYADKQVAHITQKDERPDFIHIKNAALLTREILLRFIYDGMQKSRPTSRITKHIPDLTM